MARSKSGRRNFIVRDKILSPHASPTPGESVGHPAKKKEWPGLEWRAVRELIKNKRTEDVMLVRVEDSEIPGLFSLDGYMDARKRSDEELVDAVLKRLQARDRKA